MYFNNATLYVVYLAMILIQRFFVHLLNLNNANIVL